MPKEVGPRAISPSSVRNNRWYSWVIGRAASGATLAICAASSAHAATVTSTWKAGTVGNWNDATKWTNSPAAATFPNNGNLSNVYDAVVGSGTPTLNLPVTLHTLTLNGGTIQTTAAFPAAGTNGITVTGGFRWSGGYFQVPVTVPSGATFTIDTTTGALMSYGGTFTLGGTTAFVGTNAATIQANRYDTRFDITSTGVLALDRKMTIGFPPPDPFGDPATQPWATLTNNGLITLGAGASFAGGSPLLIMNLGTIRVTGAAEFAASYYLDSYGLIDLASASAALTFRSPAGIDTQHLAGDIRLAAGSTLTFAQGGTVLNGPSVTNAGTINIQSDTRVDVVTTIPGAVNFNSNASRLTLAAPLTLTGRAVFSNGGGGPQVVGPARLTAYDFKPQGITFVGSELYTPATGSLDMGDGSSMGLSGGRVTLDGKATWGRLGGGIFASGTGVARVDVRAGALVDVRPSATATFALRSNGSTGPAADLLTNAGTIQVDNASLAVGQNWAFNNSGTVRVMPGSSATLSSALATNSGTIDLQSGTSLLVNGDVYNSAAGALGVSFRNDPTGVVRVGSSAAATFSPLGGGQMTNAGLVEVNGGRVTVDRNSFTNSGALTVNSGTAQLSGLSLSNTGTIGMGAATTLQVSANAVTNAGRIELGGGSSMTVTMPSASFGAATFRNEAGGVLKVGPAAAATFSTANQNVFANAGAVDVDHGRLTLTDDWGFSNAGSVVVTSGVMRAGLRSFTNTGGIDLRDGGGAVLANGFGNAATNLQRVRDMVVAGYHAGAWDGVGIRSASAAADPSTAVGYGPATVSGTFLGVPVVANDVLVRHTKYGDANLDGVVNFTDLLALARHYNATGDAAVWTNGDFTYDGVVNFADLLALARNYNQALPAAAIPGATPAFEADVAAALAEAAVPEPSAALLAVAACGLALGRRSRRVTRPSAVL